MKRLLTLIAVAIASMTASYVSSAQDIIHTYDSAPIKAAIQFIDDDYIHYKTWDNQDGPLYSMSLSRVEKVAFRNGTVRIFPRADRYTLPGPYGQYPIDYRRGKFYERQGRISSQEIYDYIGYTLYGSEYMKARNQYTWGISLTCIGVGGLIITLASHIASNKMDRITSFHHDTPDTGMNAGVIAGYAASAGCVAAGIPLWVKGNRGLHRIADDYNLKHTKPQPVESGSNLTLGTTRNGLGLAFNF